MASIALAGVFTFWQWMSSTPASLDAERALTVLPLANLEGEDRWTHIGAGLSMDIAGELAKSLDLAVYPPRGLEPAPLSASCSHDISHQTRYILNGTILASHDEIRVTALLTDTQTDQVIWSDRWKVPEAQLFKIQDNIVEAVGASIGSTWVGALPRNELIRARSDQPDNLDAYELFLLGSHHKHSFNPEQFAIAQSYLERSLALDPSYARAWTALSYLHQMQSMSGLSKSQRAVFGEGIRSAAKNAVLADPDAPLVLVVQNIVLADASDHAGSSELLLRAVNLAPNDPDVLALASMRASWHTKMLKEPVEWAERAIALNPEPPTYYRHALAMGLFKNREFKQALEILRDSHRPIFSLVLAAAAAGHLGLIEVAQQQRELFEHHAPADISIRELLANHGMTADPFRELVLAGTSLIGWQEDEIISASNNVDHHNKN